MEDELTADGFLKRLHAVIVKKSDTHADGKMDLIRPMKEIQAVMVMMAKADIVKN